MDSLDDRLKTSSGTNRIDIYNALSKEHLRKTPDKGLEYANIALQLSISIKYATGQAIALINIGSYYYQFKNYNQAIDNYSKALIISESAGDDIITARCYNNIGNSYLNNKEYQKALDFHQKALKIREKSKDKEEIAKSLNNIWIVLEKLGRYDEAIATALQVAHIIEEQSDKTELAKTYDFLGRLYHTTGKNNIALEYYIKEVKIMEELKDKDIDGFLINVANIYTDLNKYTEAIEYYQRALNIIKENGADKVKLARVYTRLGIVHYNMKDFEKALEYYQKSLKYAEEKGQSKGRAILLNNIGLVYKNLGKNEKALEYCLKSLDIRENIGDNDDMFYPLTSIAEIYIKLGKYNQSLDFIARSSAIARKENQQPLLKESYNLFYQAYLGLANYKDALHYHFLFTALKDSLSNEESNRKFAEMQVKYESAKKEQENQSLRKANEIQRNYFIIVILLSLVLIMVIYSRYNSKKKANSMLSAMNDKIINQHHEMAELLIQIQKSEVELREANATKDKFFAIIAHDLKNPLHAIVLSSDLLISKFKYMDGEQLLELIKNINRSGIHLSNLLANLLQWSRAQSGKIEYEPTIINLLNLVLDNINLNLDNASKKNIIITQKIPDNTIIYADYNSISTVMRNLISNALKFSHEGSEVIIKSEELENYITISVIDFGIGIIDEDIHKLFRIDIHHTTVGTLKEIGTGLGLILCKEFVELNGGEIWVKSEPDKGTVFTFTVPKNASGLKQFFTSKTIVNI